MFHIRPKNKLCLCVGLSQKKEIKDKKHAKLDLQKEIKNAKKYSFRSEKFLIPSRVGYVIAKSDAFYRKVNHLLVYKFLKFKET